MTDTSTPQSSVRNSSLPNPTRRTVLRMAWGAVTVLVTPVASTGWARGTSGGPDGSSVGSSPGSWASGAGKARYRIDGLAKVLGRKIYARDFRARDMAGWPKEEKVALALQANHVDRKYLGYDLSVLPENLQPVITVDQEQLDADRISGLYSDQAPKNRPQGFMARKGELPVYFGQPLAILIFPSADVYRRAHRLLQFSNVVRYGPVEDVPQAPLPYSPPTHLTYLDGRFSQVRNGVSNPFAVDPNEEDKTAAKVRAAIKAEIQQKVEDSEWMLVKARRSTQCIVPMFMEPESGLGWMDGDTLHMVIGTQSPNGDVQDGLTLFADKRCPIKVREVQLVSCYPGGGFGGRDVSPFTPLLMVAAAYAKGPVRIARDRFSQFQAGLTQLPASFDQYLAVDRRGVFQALLTKTVMPSGGKNNYSQFVAELAGYSAAGGYVLPRAIVDAVAQPTTAIICGSMRGFGGVQAAFAVETMVEKAARKLGMDSIELRRRNALKQGDENIMGGRLNDRFRIAEICEKASRNPLWAERAAEKTRRSRNGRLYGVGFALANQAYGTGDDGVMADILLKRNGDVVVRTTAIDMGQGSATTLALAPARWLGTNAASIEMGRVAIFQNLQPKELCKREGKRPHKSPWDNPCYTRSFSMSSSACITAFQQFHAVTQACRVLFETSIWPTAIAMWGEDPGPEAAASARWNDGMLIVRGLDPLPLAEIADVLHDSDGIVESMVHALFSVRWVTASFSVNDRTWRGPVDLLSTRRAGADHYDWHPRSQVTPPPHNASLYGRSVYAPSASLVALTVDSETGGVQLENIYTYLDAGVVHQPDLVSGQYQGGVAMGVGYALLEDMPQDAAGGGNGRWNLNKYHVALATDLPLNNIDLELLPPLEGDTTGKGIAEAVLCPIAPAIANAIHDATGQEFTNLPITASQIREALKNER